MQLEIKSPELEALIAERLEVGGSQRIGAVETAAEFFRCKAQSEGAGKGLSSYLDLIPDNPPMPGDELPMA